MITRLWAITAQAGRIPQEPVEAQTYVKMTIPNEQKRLHATMEMEIAISQQEIMWIPAAVHIYILVLMYAEHLFFTHAPEGYAAYIHLIAIALQVIHAQADYAYQAVVALRHALPTHAQAW